MEDRAHGDGEGGTGVDRANVVGVVVVATTNSSSSSRGRTAVRERL